MGSETWRKADPPIYAEGRSERRCGGSDKGSGVSLLHGR